MCRGRLSACVFWANVPFLFSVFVFGKSERERESSLFAHLLARSISRACFHVAKNHSNDRSLRRDYTIVINCNRIIIGRNKIAFNFPISNYPSGNRALVIARRGAAPSTWYVHLVRVYVGEIFAYQQSAIIECCLDIIYNCKHALCAHYLTLTLSPSIFSSLPTRSRVVFYFILLSRPIHRTHIHKNFYQNADVQRISKQYDHLTNFPRAADKTLLCNIEQIGAKERRQGSFTRWARE